MSKVLPEFNDYGYLPESENLYYPQIEEFIERFVEVDGSRKRKPIFNKYQLYCERFKSILVKLWVDGSYITSKLNPSDIDLTVHFDAIKFDDLRIIEVMERVHFMDRTYIKRQYECDTLPVPVYPEDHPYYPITKAQSAHWRKWFTKDREGILKGLIEIPL